MGIDIARRIELYNEAVHMINMLMGYEKGLDKPFEFITQFGTAGFCFFTWEEHLTYLKKINSIIQSNVFMNEELIRRWKTVNELILNFYCNKDNTLIRLESLNIATILAFTLLEEMARNISNAWDEDGLLLIDIGNEFGLTKKNSKGKTEKKLYKKGHLIVYLSHKLEILKNLLEPDFRSAIDNLNKMIPRPFIKSAKQELLSMFEKIESNKNLCLHGKKYDVSLGIFISLFICLFYFRVPED